MHACEGIVTRRFWLMTALPPLPMDRSYFDGAKPVLG
jgi:hypothetical protein